MSQPPFDPAPAGDRRYGELRCRRYLFERPPGEEPAPGDGDAPPAPAPEGWVGVRRPQ